MVEEKTVIVEREAPRGGSGWAIAIVLLIALAVGAYFLSGMSGAEASKDNAIADAASQVGNTASRVGNAAENAVKKAE